MSLVKYSARGRENDDELELAETAEAGSRFGAFPDSPSEAIELFEDENAAPVVELGLVYDSRPRIGWGKWGVLAVLGALVLFTGKKATGR